MGNHDTAQSVLFFLLTMIAIIVLSIRHDIKREKHESKIQ